MGHNRGKKKNHSDSGWGSFKKGFKHGFLGTADVISKAAPVVGLINPELGGVMAGVGELEKETLSGIDSIGAKNPNKRYEKNMAYSVL